MLFVVLKKVNNHVTVYNYSLTGNCGKIIMSGGIRSFSSDNFKWTWTQHGGLLGILLHKMIHSGEVNLWEVNIWEPLLLFISCRFPLRRPEVRGHSFIFDYIRLCYSPAGQKHQLFTAVRHEKSNKPHKHLQKNSHRKREMLSHAEVKILCF